MITLKSLKIAEYIANTIDRLPKGYVFTYDDFMGEVEKKEAVIKALNRMVESGKISKLSKGKYYKPERTPFGELQPDQSEIVKDMLEEDSKIVGYLTGLSIYNQLGLTTQVSNIIQVGKNATRPTFKRGRFTISSIRQKNTITKDNIPLLQLLDAIRYIKKIPDTTMAEASKRLVNLIKQVPEDDRSTLVRLSKKYPPSTRAYLGALLEEIKDYRFSRQLLETLNPITTYSFPGVTKVLSESENWNIE